MTVGGTQFPPIPQIYVTRVYDGKTVDRLPTVTDGTER